MVHRGDNEKHRVDIVDSESTWFGALLDRTLVKEGQRVLLQNSSVVLLKPRPHAAQQRDCPRLRPPVSHQPQACQKRKDFILRKMILCSSTRCIHTVEGEVRFSWVAGTLIAAKAPIGFEQS